MEEKISTPETPQHEQQDRTRHLPAWLAFPLSLISWWAIPWAVSLLSPRVGWQANRPGPWNWLGLLLVVPGTYGLLLGVAAHAAQSGKGIEWELDKSYFLRHGMYAFSRNPMYLSEMVLLLGWILFYGSAALLVLFAVWFVVFHFYAIPQEERILEAHYGQAYRDYKQKVPRWIGRIRQ
jgi:protein-S-isoprenylcysteine O-methyltransferase Ste14